MVRATKYPIVAPSIAPIQLSTLPNSVPKIAPAATVNGRPGQADGRAERVHADERDREGPNAVRSTNPVEMLDRVSIVEPTQSIADVRTNEEQHGEPGNSDHRRPVCAVRS